MNIARHINYVATPTECLHRVVVPILHLHLHLLPSPQPNHQQTRFISFSYGRVQLATPSHLRDESITSPLVRVVSEESGRLLPPESPKQILSRMDRQNFFLEQVSESQSLETVCKIMSKSKVVEREKRKVLPRPELEEKEVHFKWDIGPNDLKRKMGQLAGFLEEGKRVIVRLNRLKPRMIPSAERVRLLEGSVKELVEGMEGAKEYRPMEESQIWNTEHTKRRQKGNVTFYFQGPTKKQETIEGAGAKETRRLEREQEMEERKEKRRKRAEERKESTQNPMKAEI
ncbi:hypothetical protein MMC29_003713 [Sticta canariensis]|nr:hypothetical protein [Sticta canariensis]